MSGLQGESTLSEAEKVTEAKRLIEQLQDSLEQMEWKERSFVESTADTLDGTRPWVSNKQLFWLRDLALKY